MNNNRITRALQLLMMLKAAKKYKIAELAEILGISQRTVFRDLKNLRDANISWHYNSLRHCYSPDSKSDMPLPALSQKEAFCLLLILRKAGRIIQYPLAYAALTAMLKIENCLLPDVRACCDSSLDNISLSRLPQMQNDSLEGMFSRILEAMQQRQIINIHYYLPDKRKTLITDFSPYHFLYAEYAWHIIGESAFHESLQTFKLNRIKQLSPLDKYFVLDRKFDLSEYLGYAWSLIREGRIYDVELKFSPQIAAEVAEIQWHKTQTVSFEHNGFVILKFRVDGLDEITWWILSYGDQVEVMAPVELRKRIYDISRRIVNFSESNPAAT